MRYRLNRQTVVVPVACANYFLQFTSYYYWYNQPTKIWSTRYNITLYVLSNLINIQYFNIYLSFSYVEGLGRDIELN